MIPLRLADLAGLVGGVVDTGHDDVPVTGGAAVDSRAVPTGGLFVAVAGERVDGHDFAHAAVEQGAAAALVSRPVDVPHVLVPDVVVALSRLARWLVDRLSPGGMLVVGVTGSSGKTSTKDLLAQLLAAAGPTVATRGNLNNEIGLPLTVLEADATTRHLVLEMGARGPGHIADLCRTAPPRVGVELNVGAAHASEFGSKEATAAAKAELVEALPAAGSGGVAVLNADDHLVTAMAVRTSARVVRFGLDPTAEVRAEQVRLDGRGRPTYVLRAPGHDPVEVSLPLHGAHHVGNSLAAAAVAFEAGLSAPEVAGVLAAARPASRWRMEVSDRPDGVTVVNDSYNANPESVRAAIEALAAMSVGRRAWAVLGEMLELGAASTARHEEVGRLARGSGVARVVAVGEGARGVHTGALAAGAADGEESLLVPDVAAAVALLEAQLRPGDVVLVKASRGAGLDRVAAALLGEGGAAFVRQVLLAASLGLLVTLFGTPVAIRGLVRQGYGQLIRDDGPTSHHTKRGTPTMGGAVIILGTLIGYFGSHALTWSQATVSGLLVLFLMSGLGLVGFLDDYIKVSKQRSLGLRAWAKLGGQMVVAVVFAILAMNYPDFPTDFTPASTEISFIRDTGLVLGPILFVLWAYIMIAGTSNGVNLADGLDGLATGTSVMVFGSYVLMGIWQFNQNCALVEATNKCYEVRDPLDLAVVAAAIMGACFGFLWWNASPAKIFMGDTGSLALGGALAGLAITTRTELLLVLVGGLFVLIALSVILQVGFFKLTGKRVFRMAPLQHHFELVGWAEVTIVIRFWIIAGLLVALGLGVFYAEWVASVG